jgi:hypothetical protein
MDNGRILHRGRMVLTAYKAACSASALMHINERARREPRAPAVRKLVERRFVLHEWCGLHPRSDCGCVRLRLSIRALDRQAYLRPASEADLGDHRRRDHRRTIALCGGRPRADSAQRSEDLRGLVRLWLGGDREVSRASDGGRPHDFLKWGADSQPRQNRAFDLRGRREPRDGRRARRASTGCSSPCSCEVRRWIGWADNDVALLRPSSWLGGVLWL